MTGYIGFGLSRSDRASASSSRAVSLLLASIIGGVLLGPGVKARVERAPACPGEAEVLADPAWSRWKPSSAQIVHSESTAEGTAQARGSPVERAAL